MKKFSKIINNQFSKKIFLISSIIFIAAFLEMYLSMSQFSGALSSYCLKCSFFEEVFFNALLSSIFLTILIFNILKIKNDIIKFLIEFLLIISVLLFWNHSIFVGRESSWSTYSFIEEMNYTIHFSFPSILVISLISVSIINYYKRILQIVNSNTK